MRRVEMKGTCFVCAYPNFGVRRVEHCDSNENWLRKMIRKSITYCRVNETLGNICYHFDRSFDFWL